MTVKQALKIIEEFPASYDAHKDGLSEAWDHAENVNQLLEAARSLAAALKKK